MPGDYVENADGELLQVDSVEKIYLDEPVTVYNFEVDDWHTYYVSEEEILVHNMCMMTSGGQGDSEVLEDITEEILDEAETAIKNSSKPKGWKVGDPIDNLTSAGNEPSWSTVRSRYWKNEAYYNADSYSLENLARMRQGKPPLYDDVINVPMELHHIDGRNIPNANNIDNLQAVWPWEHDDIDLYRYYTGPRP